MLLRFTVKKNSN